MKKISQVKIKKQLIELGIDYFQIELVLNNISLYNDLINEYKNISKHNAYLLYQLNLQIFKMLQSINKNNKVEEAENDSFIQMINEIKNNKIKK